ncbi:cyclin-dependent kinases regulatory subunit isoform X1 [Rhipicephalus microplus]|uniref:cyclin-dependent kinases regulatory subunit isoform X1 n=1 Tax=Rhipicephalus microplus TaxID=6941 RepID=UPI003F6CC06F
MSTVHTAKILTARALPRPKFLVPKLSRYLCIPRNAGHVILPPELAQSVPKTHLMTETEWRNLGVQQSLGWEHYMLHLPEPHVLLFRRPTKEM